MVCWCSHQYWRGYELDELANIPLHSMRKRAQQQGLEFEKSFLNQYATSTMGELRVSYKKWYKLTSKHHCPIGKGENSNESVHKRVKDRFDKGPNYRPKNLVHKYS